MGWWLVQGCAEEQWTMTDADGLYGQSFRGGREPMLQTALSIVSIYHFAAAGHLKEQICLN